MSAYSGPSSVNPYWYYDPYAYQPNVSVSFNTNISVNTPPPHPSFDMYHSNNDSRFADSGYLSRTPTPPTPLRIPSPQPMPVREEYDDNEIESKTCERSVTESKPRLPYVKRTRIQYTNQQLQTLEDAFQRNHYPEVTTVDALAEILDVRHEKISIWFQNRRSRFKRQQKPKATSSTNDATKPAAHSVSMSASVPSSSSYDSSASYYPPYFWPSPVVDSRSAASYSVNPHTPSCYDNTSSPMWNTNNVSYSSPATWHHSSPATINLSLSSPSPSPSLIADHLPSM